MQYLKETTDYEAGYRVPLHTYILDKGVCIGYIKEGTTTEIFFNTPLKQFSKSRRTFKKVKPC